MNKIRKPDLQSRFPFIDNYTNIPDKDEVQWQSPQLVIYVSQRRKTQKSRPLSLTYEYFRVQARILFNITSQYWQWKFLRKFSWT